MAIDSSSPYVWRSLANWHQYGKEDLKASEQSLLKAIALDSSFAWAHGQLGVLYLQQNQVAKAERAFLNELKIDEDNYEALGSLGNLYYTEGNFTEAERYFIRSLENSIFDYRYFCRLADVYFKTGREEKADSLLRHVLAHDAISAEAYLSVGNVYSENGNLEAAAIHIQRAISLDSLNFRGWYALGKNQMRSERYAEAIPMFQRSLELKPNDVYCMNKLGESYRLSGDLEKAREVYINTHSINPESPISQMGMASLSIAEGLPNEAINFIEMAIQNGASFRQINIPEFNKLMGFDGLMKKHFPDKIKD